MLNGLWTGEVWGPQKKSRSLVHKERGWSFHSVQYVYTIYVFVWYKVIFYGMVVGGEFKIHTCIVKVGNISDNRWVHRLCVYDTHPCMVV